MRKLVTLIAALSLLACAGVAAGAGVTVVIPLSAQTIVMLDGSPATISDLRRRMTATTLRIDGGAAVRVRASSF